MRFPVASILILFYSVTLAQSVNGKYQDYFGHTLTLNKDSTFRFDWRFDLIHDWAIGRWRISGKIIDLEFIDVNDTLSRPNKPDSLVLSVDERSSKIHETELGQASLISGGQHKDRFNDKFYKRGNRLFLAKNNGRPIKSKLRGIWPQKKWPWGYKKWPTFYRRES